MQNICCQTEDITMIICNIIDLKDIFPCDLKSQTQKPCQLDKDLVGLSLGFNLVILFTPFTFYCISSLCLSLPLATRLGQYSI